MSCHDSTYSSASCICSSLSRNSCSRVKRLNFSFFAVTCKVAMSKTSSCLRTSRRMDKIHLSTCTAVCLSVCLIVCLFIHVCRIACSPLSHSFCLSVQLFHYQEINRNGYIILQYAYLSTKVIRVRFLLDASWGSQGTVLEQIRPLFG